MKKLFSFFLVMLVTITLTGTAFSKNVKADNLPVQLYFAKYLQNAIYDGSCYEYSTEGYVAVQHDGGNKTVLIHYSTDNGVTWKDTNASYLKANPTDGYEVWKYELPLDGNVPLQFAIEYTNNGATYWDNNNGKNYSLSLQNNFAFGKSKLCTNVYSDYLVTGDIFSSNLGNVKEMKVRYSYDNWATYSEINATHYTTSSDNSIDYWSYSIPAGPSNTVKFAVCYEVNGTEYWDNNFGDNYSESYIA